MTTTTEERIEELERFASNQIALNERVTETLEMLTYKLIELHQKQQNQNQIENHK